MALVDEVKKTSLIGKPVDEDVPGPCPLPLTPRVEDDDAA
jgi:hypothetical protein